VKTNEGIACQLLGGVLIGLLLHGNSGGHDKTTIISSSSFSRIEILPGFEKREGAAGDSESIHQWLQATTLV